MSTDKKNNHGAEELANAERRVFLKQLGAASVLALGAGWAALAPPHWPLSLRDPDGERGKPEENIVTLPENGFGVQSSSVLPVMGIARGVNVDTAVRAAIETIGGISRFVQTGDIVVIKPNVAFERAAALGATTNPDVLKALIYLVQEAGAREVRWDGRTDAGDRAASGVYFVKMTLPCDGSNVGTREQKLVLLK